MKKFRMWLASKILGANIVDYETSRLEWQKEQLAHGNTVTLVYEATPVIQDNNSVH